MVFNIDDISINEEIEIETIGDINLEDNKKTSSEIKEFIEITFLNLISEDWIQFERKKKKDRGIIGYGLLILIVLQMTILFTLVILSGIGRIEISDLKFSVLVTGMFAEIVGLFYIVVKNIFRDDGDQVLTSIIDLIKHNK